MTASTIETNGTQLPNSSADLANNIIPQKAHIGIELRGSGRPVKIGGNASGDRNYFKNLHIGIRAYSTTVTIINNDFQGINCSGTPAINCIPAQGSAVTAGIWLGAYPGAPFRNATIMPSPSQSNNPAYGNYFYNCANGIVSNAGYSNVYVAYSRFNIIRNLGIYSINHPANSVLRYRSNSMEYVKGIGVALYNNPQQQIYVYDNFISSGASNLTSSSGNPDHIGIDISNTAHHPYLNVKNNVIRAARIGIRVNGTAKVVSTYFPGMSMNVTIPCYVAENYVLLQSASYGAIATGYSFSNTKNALIYANEVETFSPATIDANESYGYRVSSNYGSRIICNKAAGTKRGFYFINDIQNLKFFGNRMQYNHTGLGVIGSIIGDQGVGSKTVHLNTWLPYLSTSSPNFTQHFYTQSVNGSLSDFKYYWLSGDILGAPSPLYPTGSGYSSISNNSTTFPPISFVYPGTGAFLPALYGTQPFTNACWKHGDIVGSVDVSSSAGEFADNWAMEQLRLIEVEDTISTNSGMLKQNAARSLYRHILRDGLASANDTLVAFTDSLSGSEEAEFEDAYYQADNAPFPDSASSTRSSLDILSNRLLMLDSAAQLISSINTSSDIALSREQRFAEIVLNSELNSVQFRKDITNLINDGYNPDSLAAIMNDSLQNLVIATREEKDTLIAMAWSCPLEWGDFIYAARAIALIFETDTITNYLNQCEEDVEPYSMRLAGEYSGESIAVDAVLIAPNPGRDNLLLSGSDVKAGTLLEVTDLFGRKIKTLRIANEGDYLLDLEEFISGIYMLQLTTLNGKTIQRKFSVIK